MNQLIKIIVVASSYIFAMCSEDELKTDVEKFMKNFNIAAKQKQNTQELFEKTDPSVLRSIVCEEYYVRSSLENLENSENIITKIYNATSDECDKIKFLIKMKKSAFCKNSLKEQENSNLYKFFTSDDKEELIQSFKTSEDFIKLYEKLTDTEDQNDLLELIPEEYKKGFFKSVVMPKEKKFQFYRKKYSSYGPQSRKKFLLNLSPEDQSFFEKELTVIQENVEKYKDFKEPYSINFLWIFKGKTNSDYIIPIDRMGDIVNWAKDNKVINLWYDGALLNNLEKALENTKKMLPENVCYKNIRTESELFKKYSDVFSSYKKKKDDVYLDAYLPVYFRVDLARAILGLEAVRDKNEVFVYADCDMKAANKETLFDSETQHYLHEYGMVMVHGGAEGFENGFQIIAPYQKELLSAMDIALVQSNVELGKYIIENDSKQDIKAIEEESSVYNNRSVKGGRLYPIYQTVYKSYQPMFKLFYHLNELGNLTLNGKEYNIKENSYKDFIAPGDASIFYKNNNEFSFIMNKNFPSELKRSDWIRFPTKEIKIPRSAQNFNDANAPG